MSPLLKFQFYLKHFFNNFKNKGNIPDIKIMWNTRYSWANEITVIKVIIIAILIYIIHLIFIIFRYTCITEKKKDFFQGNNFITSSPVIYIVCRCRPP